MKSLAWASLTAAAFALGVYVGAGHPYRVSGASRPAASDGAAAAGLASARAGHSGAPPAGAVPADGGAAASGVSGRRRRSTGWTLSPGMVNGPRADRLRRRLLDDLQQRAKDGEVQRAAQQLSAYLQRNPHDPDAYLLESDLRQMQGRADAALSPLLDLLQFADDPDVVQRARNRLKLLVTARETQLANTGDTAGLIRLFENLCRRDPGDDGHRLRLVHWLLAAGRADDAAEVLAETGTQGIDPQEREDAAQQVRLARTSLPLTHRDGSWYVTPPWAVRPSTCSWIRALPPPRSRDDGRRPWRPSPPACG